MYRLDDRPATPQTRGGESESRERLRRHTLPLYQEIKYPCEQAVACERRKNLETAACKYVPCQIYGFCCSEGDVVEDDEIDGYNSQLGYLVLKIGGDMGLTKISRSTVRSFVCNSGRPLVGSDMIVLIRNAYEQS